MGAGGSRPRSGEDARPPHCGSEVGPATSFSGVEGALALRFWAGGLLLWIWFVVMLRPGEMISCKAGDILIGHRLLMSFPTLVLRIANPKNRKHLGHQQFAHCHCDKRISWMTWFTEGVLRTDYIIEGGRQALVHVLSFCVRELDLDDLGITLASCRTGGVTTRFLQDPNLGSLQYAGRWANPRTLQHYLQQAAMSSLVEWSLSGCAQDLIIHAQAIFASPSRPPSVPWWLLAARRCRASHGSTA